MTESGGRLDDTDERGESEALEVQEPEIEILGFEGEREGDDLPLRAPAVDPPAVAVPTAAQIEREIGELKEKNLRLYADFDNFRKRMEREREEMQRGAVGETVRELLPVMDNLRRALSSQGEKADLLLGIEMIERQLAEVLRRFGVREVPAVGAPFDPRMHEAVSREESAEVSSPTVVAELQRGYLIGERLLRPALVKVAMPHEGEPSGRESGE
ncbi:MAG: nucleotide exchange factor GrpE [Thermoanaerobaculia bacterium]